jgi:hypothetical protein
MILRTHVIGGWLAPSVLGLVLLRCTNIRVDAQVPNKNTPNDSAPNQSASGSGCNAFDGNSEVQRMLLADLRRLRVELLAHVSRLRAQRFRPFKSACARFKHSAAACRSRARRRSATKHSRVPIPRPDLDARRTVAV